jgi:hypothetical protein
MLKKPAVSCPVFPMKFQYVRKAKMDNILAKREEALLYHLDVSGIHFL